MVDDNYNTSETLLQKIKNKHDDESWEDFVFYYKNFIYVICRRMNLNHHDTEEVVQNVLLKSWNKLPEFEYDQKKKFRGWLCQITMFCVKDFLKSAKRYTNRIEKAMLGGDLDYQDELSDIEKIAEEEWTTYITSMAMMNIKDNFSDKVMAVFEKLLNGGTPSSVANEMGIPPNTVSVYKKRVSAKIREEIKRLNYELG